MSLLLSRLSRLRLGKTGSFSLSLVSNGFSSSSLQTPPCLIVGVNPYGGLIIFDANKRISTYLVKKVPLELFDNDPVVTIGASHGWVATRLSYDGSLRLQDDLNPYASDKDPKRISLPPLVTLPHCQTEIVTNVAMSSSSPEDEDCVVALKFLGPQLSFCRPAQGNSSEWTNIRIENPCFYSSRVMFSKKDDMFRIPGSGGHLIGSWDPCKPSDEPTTLGYLRFRNLPHLTKTRQELLHSCCTSEHLVESITTGETFIVKWFRKTGKGTSKMKTKALMVFKLDDQGNAVYTEDIGDLCIFLSKSEPFCVHASSFPGIGPHPGIGPNKVKFSDVDEDGTLDLWYSSIISRTTTLKAPYHIPPQNIN